jgi:hypothetical protein
MARLPVIFCSKKIVLQPTPNLATDNDTRALFPKKFVCCVTVFIQSSARSSPNLVSCNLRSKTENVGKA